MKINRTTGPLLSYIALAAGAYFILTNMNNKKDPTKPTVVAKPNGVGMGPISGFGGVY